MVQFHDPQQENHLKVINKRSPKRRFFVCTDFTKVTASLYLPPNISWTDFIRESAELAANQISTQIPPGRMTIVKFKVLNDTVYYLLNAEVPGGAYAGISIALAQVKPLVERTLRLFQEVKEVKNWPI